MIIKKSWLTLALGLSAALQLKAADTSTLFNGAEPNPIGLVSESVSQFQVRFPTGILKKGNASPFKVSCLPEVEGFPSWADNETLWTYNFKSKSGAGGKLPGGTKCQVAQIDEITGSNQTIWKKGTLNYSVTIMGPKVTQVHVAHGFNQTLREKEPLLLIVFDGPVDRKSLYENGNSYLNYTSANAPSEKILLSPVPLEQLEKLFNEFKTHRYFDPEFKDSHWALVTVKQNLIPGANIRLTIRNQVSGINADVAMPEKYEQEFSVRSQFQAEILCSQPSAKPGTCLPNSPITVNLNGRVKWTDLRKTYIEYIPYNSKDKKAVQSFPEIQNDSDIDIWDSVIDFLSSYFPFLEKYSDTVVDSIVFKVKIEPETQAKVVLPKNLVDIDNRRLANALTTFHIKIGSMREWIRTPNTLAIYERNNPKLAIPIQIVNLNQKVRIRKSGSDKKEWKPIQDVPTMIRLIRTYESSSDFRDSKDYLSPLDRLNISNNVQEKVLTGTKNRPEILQVPIAQGTQKITHGLYAMEISSPSLEQDNSNEEYNSYLNPSHILTQITDLAIHMKKGTQNTLIWVTRLSSATPVPQAEISLYNCNGEKILSTTTDANGLISVKNQEWAKDCQRQENDYSQYTNVDEFFARAQMGDDAVLIHSSWISGESYAFGSPGVDWFETSLNENSNYYHSIVAVNLVKPGQSVPVQLIAKRPELGGFSEVPVHQLPKVVRIASNNDEDTYYDFPLNWNEGKAEFTWKVPGDSSVKLGSYSILVGDGTEGKFQRSSGDIEVAEFKIPLMTGLINFPNQTLVKPDAIPVNTAIRYANGVGAKDLSMDVSYYFEPTYIESKELPGFTFGNGTLRLQDDGRRAEDKQLPSSERPSTVTDLKTNADGALTLDIAKQNDLQGRTIAEALKDTDRPQKLVVRARYQDQVGEYQTLSQAKDIYNSNVYLGTKIVSGLRNEAKLLVAAISSEKKNLTDLADLNIKIERIETKIIGEELYGGIIKNTLERQLKPVRWTNDCHLEKGVVACSVGALKTGNYAMQVSSKSSQQQAYGLFKVDDTGRVYGPNDYYLFGDEMDSKTLALATNKQSYRHGETAVVSFPSPFKSCKALVTLERSDVIESFVTDNACQKGNVEIPIRASMAPNAFVSVYLITGRADTGGAKVGEQDLGRPTYRLGFANIKVDWQQFRNQVKVQLNKETFQPKETVEVQAMITPEVGGSSEGTVTFVAIEEKILTLKSNNTYQILNSLMQLRGHDVSTITSLERIETAADAASADPEAAGAARKGGDEGGDGSGSAEFRRKLFDALVAFKTNVPVVNGVAKFSFKANDSLTRFKIFAISMDSKNRFGVGEAQYLSAQDVQSYSNIPSVAYTGDEYPIRVTVQNNSKADAQYRTEVSVTIKDSNGKILDTKNLKKSAKIGAATSSAIDAGLLEIPSDAAKIEYEIRIYDENGKLVDQLTPEAQTILPTVPLTVQRSYLAQMDQTNWSKKVLKPDGAVKGKGQLQITVANSLVTGTIEQVKAQIRKDVFADTFIESKFYKSLLLGSEKRSAELLETYSLLMSSLDNRGFIKYYPRAFTGDLYLTARMITALDGRPWALALMPKALAQKLKLGIKAVLSKEVPPNYVGRTAMDWARAQMQMINAAFALNDEELKSQAMTVASQILTNISNNPVIYGQNFKDWNTSDLVTLWVMNVNTYPLIALDSETFRLLTQPSRLVYLGNSAQLIGKPSFLMNYTDETIETSQFLRGLSAVKGSKDLARALALGLTSSQSKGGWYNSTTLMFLENSLDAFARSYETSGVTGSSQVSVSGSSETRDVKWIDENLVTVNQPWLESESTIEVHHKGEGLPWIGIQALAAVPLTAPVAQGISIEKSIRNLNRPNGFRAGDVIEVELTLNSVGRLMHLALHDPIPAGSNILNEAYGDYSSGQKKYSGYWMYFNFIPAGRSTVKYQYQLNNPGKFRVSPTRIEGIYLPSVFAEVPNSILSVE